MLEEAFNGSLTGGALDRAALIGVLGSRGLSNGFGIGWSSSNGVLTGRASFGFSNGLGIGSSVGLSNGLLPGAGALPAAARETGTARGGAGGAARAGAGGALLGSSKGVGPDDATAGDAGASSKGFSEDPLDEEGARAGVAGAFAAAPEKYIARKDPFAGASAGAAGEGAAGDGAAEAEAGAAAAEDEEGAAEGRMSCAALLPPITSQFSFELASAPLSMLSTRRSHYAWSVTSTPIPRAHLLHLDDRVGLLDVGSLAQQRYIVAIV